MKSCVSLALLLALGCVHVRAAPLEGVGMVEGSCEDPVVLGAANQALMKINEDRQEGYVFALHRLANAHFVRHDEHGVVFYLNLDVVETNCSVLSRKHWKHCEPRTGMTHYGQCKAAIFINRGQRVVRLYKYSCEIRPIPAARLAVLCPDCPMYTNVEGEQVKNLVTASLEKFNQESNLAKHFALEKVTRATSGYAMSMYYHVEYTIQETVCPRGAEVVTAEKCPPMQCEFTHKGFCKASLYHNPMNDAMVDVECEIFEPEAAEREKKNHLLGGATDHAHADTAHTHGGADDRSHDHVHDHTQPHRVHDSTHVHAHDSSHHHTHDHASGSGHQHHHAHSHDHGHDHDHVHAHHSQAHDHSRDVPNQHHDYKHADGVQTHDHDHELALDHDHKHPHLHEHEHHHHHHDHQHETTDHREPQGLVRTLPAIDQPAVLPSFPDVPAAGSEVGVVLPLRPDPQIPGATEPTILPFPTSYSAQCSASTAATSLVDQLLSEDPLFRRAA